MNFLGWSFLKIDVIAHELKELEDSLNVKETYGYVQTALCKWSDWGAAAVTCYTCIKLWFF